MPTTGAIGLDPEEYFWKAAVTLTVGSTQPSANAESIGDIILDGNLRKKILFLYILISENG